MSTTFEQAAAWLTNNSNLSLSNEQKLELYALFKIATCNSLTPLNGRPGMFDFAGKAKYDSWSAKGKTLSNASEAEDLYIEFVKSFGWSEGQEETVTPGQAPVKGWRSVSALANDEHELSSGSIHDLATDGDVEGVTRLPNLSSVINLKDDYGYTPLHLAADRGHEELVRFLLRIGADAQIKDNDGQTALALAQCAEQTSIVILLEQEEDS